MKKFPTLYKKTSTGALQGWDISVLKDNHGNGVITTDYGQVGTDNPQSTSDIISEGKNVGKKNETTPFEQAQAEAQAKWEKQKKKGYVETPSAALADEVDELIEGGIVPMLAHKFADHAHKIKYPAYAQPKLDGIRCIAILKDGKCTLWSRTRKLITSVPHIVEEIERIFGNHTPGVILDGELYNHDYKTNFEKIVSLVRQEVPAVGHEVVQYHVYDVATSGTFDDHTVWLQQIFKQYTFRYLKRVATHTVDNEDQVMEYFAKYRSEGYEGVMMRNAQGKYANKRSYDLQKVKEFDDAEFKILSVEEGRGKLAGHVGAFLCQMDNGKEFLAKMSGDTEQLARYFRDHSLWKGKKLTVKYQGLTGANGVPRFPIGVVIRDYE